MGAEVHSQAKTFRNVALFFAAWVLVCVLVPFDTDLRIGFGILGGLGALGFTLAWLLAPRPLAVEAPDVLAGVAPDCFECDGLCFAPTLEVADGLCWFNVYCQNRYDRPCRATVGFIPMEGLSRSPGEPNDVPPLITELDCDGGEAAVVRFPYPIGARWQGRIMIYDVTGVVRYPEGRGRLIRSRAGLPVRGPSSKHADALRLAGVAALGMFGILAIGLTDRPTASRELRLPEGVAEQLPPDVAQRTETLSVMDLPTGGFPVSPPSA